MAREVEEEAVSWLHSVRKPAQRVEDVGARGPELGTMRVVRQTNHGVWRVPELTPYKELAHLVHVVDAALELGAARGRREDWGDQA